MFGGKGMGMQLSQDLIHHEEDMENIGIPDWNLLNHIACVGSGRYRLYKLLLSTHSVYELLCLSTRKIAFVAYEEARHRKVSGLHVACINNAGVCMLAV